MVAALAPLLTTPEVDCEEEEEEEEDAANFDVKLSCENEEKQM